MLTEESDTVRPDASSGICYEGYRLEVCGARHEETSAGNGHVELPDNTGYTLVVTNDKPNRAMVSLTIDSRNIGSFLLQPYSRYPIKRPYDEPTPFMFPGSGCQPGQAKSIENQRLSKQTKDVTEQAVINACVTNGPLPSSLILADFYAEASSGVISFEISSADPAMRRGMDFRVDDLMEDAWRKLEEEFGAWVIAPHCCVITWNGDEATAPVEEVFMRAKYEKKRLKQRAVGDVITASLVLIEVVQVHTDDGQVLDISFSGLPFLQTIYDDVNKAMEREDKPSVYFLSQLGRYVCHANADTCDASLFDFLHKEEIMSHPRKLVVKATLSPPSDSFRLTARASGSVFALAVGNQTTVHGCTSHLLQAGCGECDNPHSLCWFFAGLLLDKKHTLSHYGVCDRCCVDVITRSTEEQEEGNLVTREPVAVTSEVSVVLLGGQTDTEITRMTQEDDRPATGDAAAKSSDYRQQYAEAEPIPVNQHHVTNITITINDKDKPENSQELQTIDDCFQHYECNSISSDHNGDEYPATRDRRVRKKGLSRGFRRRSRCSQKVCSVS